MRVAVWPLLVQSLTASGLNTFTLVRFASKSTGGRVNEATTPCADVKMPKAAAKQMRAEVVCWSEGGGKKKGELG